VLRIFPPDIMAALSVQGGRLSMMTPSRMLLLPLIMRRWCSIMRSTGISSSGMTIVATSALGEWRGAFFPKVIGFTKLTPAALQHAAATRRGRTADTIVRGFLRKSSECIGRRCSAWAQNPKSWRHKTRASRVRMA